MAETTNTTYYVYMILDTKTSKYYIGKSSCIGDPNLHSYCGAGVWIRKLSQHVSGRKNMPNCARLSHFNNYPYISKTIVGVFDNENDAFVCEKDKISDLWKTDINCMNIVPGGKGGARGIDHPNVDSVVYRWVNVDGRILHKTQTEMADIVGDNSRSCISACLHGYKKSFRGWYYGGTEHNPIIPSMERKQNDTTYRCFNVNDGMVLYVKRHEMPDLIGCSITSLNAILSRGYSTKNVNGWYYIGDNDTDFITQLSFDKEYTWIHKDGNTMNKTKNQMNTYLNCHINSIHKCINGTSKSIKGWKVVSQS